MSLPFVFINEVFSTRNVESLAITPPQKCIQVIDDRTGSDIKDIMKKDSQSQGLDLVRYWSSGYTTHGISGSLTLHHCTEV